MSVEQEQISRKQPYTCMMVDKVRPEMQEHIDRVREAMLNSEPLPEKPIFKCCIGNYCEVRR